MIILNLPFPVSVNAMYANKLKARKKSDRYATWINAAGWELAAQRQKPVHGPYHLHLILFQKDNRRLDPDNFIKAVSDLLVTHKLIDDDSECVSLSVERFKHHKRYCQVQVRPSNGIPNVNGEREAA